MRVRDSKFARHVLGLSSMIAMSISMCSTASAADEKQADSEIVVTALKSNVTAQDAPVSVNVVEGERLIEQAVTSVEQLTTAVPGVRIQQAPQGSIFTNVRGLGSSPTTNTFDQTVGLYVDGVYAGHGREYAAALFDVARIELLKGTQGATVGRSSSMGALALTTNKPDFELGGSLGGSYEFELGTTTVDAAVNVPISDAFAIRLAGISSDEGGWVHNALLNEGWPKVKRKGARVSLRFRPDDNLDWTVYAQYSEQQVIGQYFRPILPNATLTALAPSYGDTGWTVGRYQSRISPRSGTAGFPLIPWAKSQIPGSDFSSWKLASNLSYDLGPVTLTSVTGYTKYDETNLIDGVGFPQLLLAGGADERNSQFSQELRVSTNGEGPISFVGGMYYWKDNWDYTLLQDYNAPAAGQSGSLARPVHQDTKSIDLYGQVTWKATDRIWLTGGVRYENYKKRMRYDGVTVFRTLSAARLATNSPFPAFQRSRAEDYLDFSIQPQFFITPDLQVYGSYATGTKGFGYALDPTSTPAQPAPIVDPSFPKERSKTWEAGVKWTIGNRGRLNLSYFNTKVNDFQFATSINLVRVFRSDQLKSEGFEIDASYEPLPGLTAGLTATYANVTKRVPVPNTIPGQPYAPKWSGIGTLDYRTSISDDLEFKSNLTFEFRSSQVLRDDVPFGLPEDPGRVRTDLRLAVDHKPSNVELALIARNIFNTYGISYAYPALAVIGVEELPRTIGIQARVKF